MTTDHMTHIDAVLERIRNRDPEGDISVLVEVIQDTRRMVREARASRATPPDLAPDSGQIGLVAPARELEAIREVPLAGFIGPRESVREAVGRLREYSRDNQARLGTLVSYLGEIATSLGLSRTCTDTKALMVGILGRVKEITGDAARLESGNRDMQALVSDQQASMAKLAAERDAARKAQELATQQRDVFDAELIAVRDVVLAEPAESTVDAVRRVIASLTAQAIAGREKQQPTSASPTPENAPTCDRCGQMLTSDPTKTSDPENGDGLCVACEAVLPLEIEVNRLKTELTYQEQAARRRNDHVLRIAQRALRAGSIRQIPLDQLRSLAESIEAAAPGFSAEKFVAELEPRYAGDDADLDTVLRAACALDPGLEWTPDQAAMVRDLAARHAQLRELVAGHQEVAALRAETARQHPAIVDHDLAEALDRLHRCIVHDARDWSATRRDALIYALVVGWGGAWSYIGRRHGWAPEDVAMIRRLNAAVCRHKASNIPVPRSAQVIEEKAEENDRKGEPPSDEILAWAKEAAAFVSGDGLPPQMLDAQEREKSATQKATRHGSPATAEHPPESIPALLASVRQLHAVRAEMERRFVEVSPATADQPPPKPNTSTPIADLVVKDIEARVQLGVQRYGTKLQAHNGRDALVDAYQEAIDLAMYLRQALEERAGENR